MDLHVRGPSGLTHRGIQGPALQVEGHILPQPPVLTEPEELLETFRGTHEGFPEPRETRIVPENRGPRLPNQIQDYLREHAIVKGLAPCIY